jgi:hypothetical protein
MFVPLQEFFSLETNGATTLSINDLFTTLGKTASFFIVMLNIVMLRVVAPL